MEIGSAAAQALANGHAPSTRLLARSAPCSPLFMFFLNRFSRRLSLQALPSLLCTSRAPISQLQSFCRFYPVSSHNAPCSYRLLLIVAVTLEASPFLAGTTAPSLFQPPPSCHTPLRLLPASTSSRHPRRPRHQLGWRGLCAVRRRRRRCSRALQLQRSCCGRACPLLGCVIAADWIGCLVRWGFAVCAEVSLLCASSRVISLCSPLDGGTSINPAT